MALNLTDRIPMRNRKLKRTRNVEITDGKEKEPNDAGSLVTVYVTSVVTADELNYHDCEGLID